MVRGGLVWSGAVAPTRQWTGKDTVVDCDPFFVSRPLILKLTTPALPADLSLKVTLYERLETFVTLTVQRATPGW